jgi:hypothetical protein
MHLLAIALLSTVSVLQPAAQPADCDAPDPTQIGKFEVESDLFLAHFDLKTDVDDLHSVAAVATMLADPCLSEVQHHAVAGAYGKQGGPYVPANELFEAAFGEHWSDAHNDFDQALREVKARVRTALDAGGEIWIAEGGQSDFTAALLRAVRDERPDIDTRQRVHVVQHSDWNEESTTAEDLRYVKEHAAYHKIPDGNAGGNGTPKLRASEPVDWQSHVQAPALAEIWRLAIEIANTYNGTENRYTNSAIADGGLDFSDTVETCWIFGHDGLTDAKAFFQEFGAPSE